jgi:DnaJ-class molecular chaperone
MQFPPHIQKALTTLDIVYPFTQKDIKKQYHKLLKENHPDRQNTIQSSKNVQNIRHYTVDEITDSYKILCDFFGIK